MGAVRFSIDPGLIRCLGTVVPLETFVETGTYDGDAIAAVRHEFEWLHTIELDPDRHAKAAKRFAGDERIAVHHGNAPEVLRRLAPELEGRPVVYWLDAHWCEGVADPGTGQCPLLDELESIGSLGPDSVLLIDDARLLARRG